MNFFRSLGIAVAAAKISRARWSPTTRSFCPAHDDEQGVRRDVGQVGALGREDLAGEDRDDGLGLGQVGLGGDGGHLRREVAAGGMADQGEPGPVGADVRGRGGEDVEGVADGDQAVGQEVGRRRHPVALVTGGDHDPPAPCQVFDPGAVNRRVDGEPAVVEDHHRRRLGRGVGGLEKPVRAGPFPHLGPLDRLVGIARRRVGGVHRAGYPEQADGEEQDEGSQAVTGRGASRQRSGS